MIEKSAEGVGPAGAVMSDVALRETAVVDGVVGLNRSDDVQLGEALEILRRHVLGVLDSETTIGVAVSLDYVGIQVKNCRYAIITNGMGADLQAGFIRFHHALAHEGDGMHLVGEQAPIVALVQERFVEVGCAGTKRAVGISLYCANAQVWTAKSVADTDPALVVRARDERRCVDASSQL